MSRQNFRSVNLKNRFVMNRPEAAITKIHSIIHPQMERRNSDSIIPSERVGADIDLANVAFASIRETGVLFLKQRFRLTTIAIVFSRSKCTTVGRLLLNKSGDALFLPKTTWWRPFAPNWMKWAFKYSIDFLPNRKELILLRPKRAVHCSLKPREKPVRRKHPIDMENHSRKIRSKIMLAKHCWPCSSTCRDIKNPENSA